MKILLLIFIAFILASLRRVNHEGKNRTKLSCFELCLGLVGFMITFVVKTILQMKNGITIHDVLSIVLCLFIAVLVVGVYKSLIIVRYAENTTDSISALSLSNYVLLILGIVGSIVTLFLYFLL